MSSTNTRQRRVERMQGRRGTGRSKVKAKIASPVAPPRMRRFAIQMEAEVRIDERLLDDVLTDEWRSSFYPLHTPADVAEHLGFNLIQGRRLSSLDGFADQDDLRAFLDTEDLVTDVAEIDERELSAPARRVADGVKDAIHAASDGQLSHDQAIRALDEIVRHVTDLRRAYIRSKKIKARRASQQSRPRSSTKRQDDE